MEELYARIEALERRLERAEEALRGWEAWGLRLPSVPVTFKDVFVEFSGDEWALLDDEQKELHRSVMQSNCEMLLSLYCDLAKPEDLLQMERGEPCVPAEPDLEGTAVSLKPGAEPVGPGCASSEALLQVETEQSPKGRCRNPEDSRSPSDAPDSSARADVGIPGEVLQEGIGAEEGLQKEDVGGAGNRGQYPAADAPAEPSREEMPDLCQTAARVEPGGSAGLLGKPEESVGRTAACQRNSSREKFYRCMVCGKNFLLKINLIIHQKSHSNWVPYVCIECDQAFTSKKKIRRHLRIRAATGFCPPSGTEGGSSLAPCRAAQPHGRGSSTREQWERPNPNLFPPPPQKITYTCMECMENFSSQSFLVLHQRTHANRHHFTLCLCCNRSFVWASQFVRQSAAGRKGYWCSECQKACKRLRRPRGHRKTDVRRGSPHECSSKLPLHVEPV
ncbi:zinc finger protein 268 isoform X4 [Gallus gallus]|uniref:zinc finger protein 268 isoform X4 n=1 Tax=Gallus gallus TaxID=9031 RepID=UPI001AEB4B78|nr:zinc finger protein 268 isoform X4 [Gallus gallus]